MTAGDLHAISYCILSLPMHLLCTHATLPPCHACLASGVSHPQEGLFSWEGPFLITSRFLFQFLLTALFCLPRACAATLPHCSFSSFTALWLHPGLPATYRCPHLGLRLPPTRPHCLTWTVGIILYGRVPVHSLPLNFLLEPPLFCPLAWASCMHVCTPHLPLP